MDEIKKKHRIIDGKEMVTWQAEFTDDNIMQAETGTTGFLPEEATTFIKLSNSGSTNMQVSVTDEGVAIIFHGNSELLTLAKSLAFFQKVLDDQIREAGAGICD